LIVKIRSMSYLALVGRIDKTNEFQQEEKFEANDWTSAYS